MGWMKTQVARNAYNYQVRNGKASNLFIKKGLTLYINYVAIYGKSVHEQQLIMMDMIMIVQYSACYHACMHG